MMAQLRYQEVLDILRTVEGTVELVAALVLVTCLLAVAWSVMVSFALYGRNRDAKHRTRSVVDTASMTGFAVVYFIVIQSRIGSFPRSDLAVQLAAAVVGLAIVVFGAAVNILGRARLAENWADQVTLYREQHVVQTGVYAVVRHPLYASTIWMLAGAAIVYLSIPAMLLDAVVFIPAMYYRARQEERLLTRHLVGYAEYRERVGMLFPRLAPQRRHEDAN